VLWATGSLCLRDLLDARDALGYGLFLSGILNAMALGALDLLSAWDALDAGDFFWALGILWVLGVSWAFSAHRALWASWAQESLICPCKLDGERERNRGQRNSRGGEFYWGNGIHDVMILLFILPIKCFVLFFIKPAEVAQNMGWDGGRVKEVAMLQNEKITVIMMESYHIFSSLYLLHF